MWAIEGLQQIKAASKGGTRRCCPDPVQAAARHARHSPAAAGPGTRSWECLSLLEGGLLPLGALALHSGELGATQPQAFWQPWLVQAPSPLPRAVEGAAAPSFPFSLSPWCASGSGHGWRDPLPNGAGAAHWTPTVTLLLLFVALCRRCSSSSPGPSFPHPVLPPSTLQGDRAGRSILRPLPVRQIGLELAGGLRSY